LRFAVVTECERAAMQKAASRRFTLRVIEANSQAVFDLAPFDAAATPVAK
jgi:hypothetical protein